MGDIIADKKKSIQPMECSLGALPHEEEDGEKVADHANAPNQEGDHALHQVAEPLGNRTSWSLNN